MSFNRTIAGVEPSAAAAGLGSSVDSLLAQGIIRMRLPYWAHPSDYIVVAGAWVHLFSRNVQDLFDDIPTPQSFPFALLEPRFGWEPYQGPIDTLDNIRPTDVISGVHKGAEAAEKRSVSASVEEREP